MSEDCKLYNHHALLFRVDSLNKFNIPEYFLKEDILVLEYDQFKIKQVKEVVQLSSHKPARGKFRILVIKFSYIFHEAQNALLKILEEPPVSTKFILVTLPNTELLSTVLSRLQFVQDFLTENADKADVNKTNDCFYDFVTASYKQRLSIIESVIKEKKHDWISDFRKGLHEWLNQNQTKLSSSDFKKIIDVSKYLLRRGSNNKMLLEYFAIYLPKKNIIQVKG